MFGSLILVLISSGGKVGFIASLFIALVLAFYMTLTARLFDLIYKFGSFIKGNFFKKKHSIISGIV